MNQKLEHNRVQTASEKYFHHCCCSSLFIIVGSKMGGSSRFYRVCPGGQSYLYWHMSIGVILPTSCVMVGSIYSQACLSIISPLIATLYNLDLSTKLYYFLISMDRRYR